MEEKLTERDYEVLDACCELLSIKIDELKAENDRLKQEVRTEKIYSSQIEELEESLNHLKQENDTLKNKLSDAEAVMLTYKADKEKYYQQTLDDEIQLNELLQTLQEIKKIAKNSCCMTDIDLCVVHSCINCKSIPNTDVIKQILQKITKAEVGNEPTF